MSCKRWSGELLHPLTVAWREAACLLKGQRFALPFIPMLVVECGLPVGSLARACMEGSLRCTPWGSDAQAKALGAASFVTVVALRSTCDLV